MHSRGLHAAKNAPAVELSTIISSKEGEKHLTEKYGIEGWTALYEERGVIPGPAAKEEGQDTINKNKT